MASKKVPSFEYALCMACGSCLPACPFGCLSLSKQGLDRYRTAFPRLDRPESCTGCALCAKACPVDCIGLVAASDLVERKKENS